MSDTSKVGCEMLLVRSNYPRLNKRHIRYIGRAIFVERGRFEDFYRIRSSSGHFLESSNSRRRESRNIKLATNLASRSLIISNSGKALKCITFEKPVGMNFIKGYQLVSLNSCHTKRYVCLSSLSYQTLRLMSLSRHNNDRYV